ncbi:IS21-like element helper ATPase IstB [Labilibaculum sp. K2S]|uniref:IS21-like element helper ATPase IstB n=1 Tax=Labilibaculum sp. K2S TaxID=3056386 RepID=UPI0025A368BE|nr:IS21-like element helper ATPase IstB [Labilibaculum sp. K2S]MDM8162228.1 IS21-like element helper ATPase IstB [Labilibaculum sp. K2S]
MNHQTSIEKMKQMRLTAMAETYYNSLQTGMYKDYTIDQFIALLVDQEWEHRHNKKIANLIASAKFRDQTTVEDIDYTASRSLDRNVLERLTSLDFLKRKENLIITGLTGTGKSYIAQALGHRACLMQHKTLYYNTTRLMDDVRLARTEGTYIKLLVRIEKADLLILDDFGLNSFDPTVRTTLMDIVESKYDKTSIIIATQIPVKCWHELIGEGTIADAILDRLVHSSHRIELSGESMRKNKLKTVQNNL